jgi:hypothetical protein
MLRRRTDLRANRITWSVSVTESVPVDIDLTALESEIKLLHDLSDCGWLESSYDLQHGLRVRELPMDKLPEELIRTFARRKVD